MDYTNATTEELIERRAAINADCENADADLTALLDEARAINAELENRKAKEAERKELRDLVSKGAGDTIQKFDTEEKHTMTNEEIRSTQAYVEAFANYIKTGDERECRALLTENVSGGQLPVPSIVDGIIRTAWERDEIMNLVRKTNIKGNLKVAFERSATAAAIHTEGANAPTEETLTLGIVSMIPATIKKWITISDEAVAMGGEAFVRYIYDELTYQIVRYAASLAVGDISGASASHSATAVGVPKLTLAPSVTTIPAAAANLSDEASNVVVIMNRLTEVNFLAAQAGGSFAIDPFAGYRRLYTSALPAYDAASANAVYAIVGDLKGEQFNFPEGDDVIIKWDDLSLAEKDLVKVVGRLYAGHAVTAPGHFCNIAKPSGN